MTLKNDGEGISKRILDWLTGIITLAAAFSTIIGVFFSDDKKAQQFAYIAAFLLIVVSGAIFFYQRRRAARLKIGESLEPLSASAALRGLLPFEEGDELPGRARDVQELYTLVASRAFRFGVLWGESGCGKTSLLRAGLTPKLRNEKFIPLYINKPTKDPQEAIRSALTKEVPNLEKHGDKNLEQLLKGAAPKGKKILILFDQFEEFFLTNRASSSRAGFVKWLGEVVNDENLPVAFLIAIRADFFAQLQNFAPQIPEPTSARSTYQLQNFDTEQAKQIFSAAAKADGIPFEPALIQAVVKELEMEEFIRPAELQVVGTRLKRKNIFTLNRYEALGGAKGILSSYIGDEIKQSPNQQAARLVLRLMCADVIETKSQIDLSMDDIRRGISGTGEASDATPASRPEEIQTILNRFVAARVLIHTDEDKYNLVHDYLAPYVRTATEGTETNVERANRMLKRYVAEYKEDSKTRIPFGRVRWIQKYASAETKAAEKSRELIRKSKRGFYITLGSFVSVPIILIASLSIFLANSYYFSVQDTYIVLLSGNPQWKFVPGFDQVMIQTEFKDSDLDSKSRDEILNGQVTGFWFQQAEGGYSLWGEQLADHLSIVPQSEALRWLDQTTRVADILIQTITDSKTDPDLRSNAVSALGSLAQAKPEAVNEAMLNKLIEFITTNSDASLYQVRSIAAYALGSLAQAKPEAVNEDMLDKLIEFIVTNSDTRLSYVHSNAASALGSLAQAKPEAVNEEMLNKLIEFILTNSDASLSNARYSAATALGSLALANPQAGEQTKIIPTLIDLLQNDADNTGREVAVRALFQIAIKEPGKGSFIRAEIEKLQASSQPHLRMTASKALEMLAIGDLYEEAVAHPEQREQIKSRLINFNEDHLIYAASIVREEIDKLDAAEK